MSANLAIEAEPYAGESSKARALALLGPEVMADIAARVAAAPPPSPEKVALVARLFAVIPPARTP
jgi:hypothetical protein